MQAANSGLRLLPRGAKGGEKRRGASCGVTASPVVNRGLLRSEAEKEGAREVFWGRLEHLGEQEAAGES